MPEGDTILRAARALHVALSGRTVTGFQSALPRLTHPLEGKTVEAVDAVGKHLLMRFSGDVMLRTHMGMHGSWHIYRPGERWRHRRSAMRILIATPDIVAVAFNVHEAEFRHGRAATHIPAVDRLGPDLLAEQFDTAGAMARIRQKPDAEIADVLLDQQLVAGAGNIYKSEALFACSVSPFIRVEALSDVTLKKVIDTARVLLQRNVEKRMATGPWMRRTMASLNPGARFAVYGRRGKPCRRCGTSIRSRRQGPHARTTDWCPKCQAESREG